MTSRALRPLRCLSMGMPRPSSATVTDDAPGCSVSVIDAEELMVIYSAKVGRYPEGIVRLADGSKVYVGNWASDDLSVLNGDGKELKRLPIGVAVRGMVVVPGR